MPASSIASGFAWRPTAPALLVAAAGPALAVGSLLTVSAGLSLNPFLVLIALPILIGWVGGIVFGPLVFLCFAAATAGFSFSWFEGLAMPIVGRSVNPNGLHWGGAFMVASVLLVRFGAGPLPKLFRPYAAFVLLAAVGLAWTPDWFDGLKQALQFGLSLLLGWLAYRTIQTREAIHRMTVAWWVGLVFSVTLALVMAAAALPSYLGLAGVLGNRSFGMHLLPFFAMAVGAARERVPGASLVAAGVCAIGVLTLSRMALAVMLALGLIAFLVGRGPRRLVGVIGVVFLGWAALQFQPLRERIFLYANTGFTGFRLEVVGSGIDTQLTFGNINLSGRGLTWVQTFMHAREAWLVGHGTGSATTFLERDVGMGISHPHNDYLRVLHDFGVVGLALVLYVGGFVLTRLWRLHRTAPGSWSRGWTSAALLAWLAWLMMALTDNSMIYPTYFSGGVFMILAIALRAVELERVSTRVSAGNRQTSLDEQRPVEVAA
jgi:hypothetical protein